MSYTFYMPYIANKLYGGKNEIDGLP